METIPIQFRKKFNHGIVSDVWIARWTDEKTNKRVEVAFSEGNHGKYAKILAEKSLKLKRRIHNYFKKNKNLNCAIMKLFSKTYGYIDVLIDIEDIKKIKNIVWMVSKVGNTFYIRNNKYGRLHRFILDTKDDKIVDHKNRNPLDNRKENLINNTTIEVNNKNKSLSKNNKSGIKGVRCDGKYWWAIISYKNKQKSTSFSIKKYGFDEAKKLAVEWRIEQEKKFNYK